MYSDERSILTTTRKTLLINQPLVLSEGKIEKGDVVGWSVRQPSNRQLQGL